MFSFKDFVSGEPLSNPFLFKPADYAGIAVLRLPSRPTPSDLFAAVRTLIFRREREQGVQPILKEDVAEVLRRRFFTPESIRDREAFRPHVVAALKGIAELDEQTRKEGKGAEDRFLQSYPYSSRSHRGCFTPMRICASSRPSRSNGPYRKWLDIAVE